MNPGLATSTYSFACKTNIKRVNKSFARVYKKIIYAKAKFKNHFCLQKTSLQVLFVYLIINYTKSLQTLKEKKKKIFIVGKG